MINELKISKEQKNQNENLFMTLYSKYLKTVVDEKAVKLDEDSLIRLKHIVIGNDMISLEKWAAVVCRKHFE